MEVKHGMCGNGIRCLAKYLYEENLIIEKNFEIETLSGNKNIELFIENKTVVNEKIDMGIITLGEEIEIKVDEKIFRGFKVLVR